MTVADPSFDKELSMISIPDAPRREFRVNGKLVTGDVEISGPSVVTVRAKRGFKLPADAQTEFTFDPEGVQTEVVDPEVEILHDLKPEVTSETVDNRRFGRQ